MASRYRTLKGGRFFSEDLLTWVDCTVRDLSETGARLTLRTNLPLPKAGYLYLTGAQTIAPVRVAWRADLSMGVQFVEPLRPAASHASRRVRGIRLA